MSNVLYCVVCLCVGGWLAWDATSFGLVTFSPWADYWEHTAVLSEWLHNFSDPSNPHVNDPSLSSRFMPYFMALTFAGSLLGLDAVQLMSVSTLINFVLIAVGLYFFSRAYFRNYWAPLVAFIVIFTFWGAGWNWSNLYQLRSFFYVSAYPSTFVFGLSLVSFWVTMRLLHGQGQAPWLAGVLMLLAILMFLCHPLTGVFGIVGCAVLALTEPTNLRNSRLLAIGALLVGMGLAEFWPYFSVWKLSLGLYGAGDEQWFSSAEIQNPLDRFASGDWKHIFYDPRLIAINLGVSLLGVPLLAWLALRRSHMFMVLGALLMLVPYTLHLFFEVPLAHRFLLFVVFYLQMAIVWGWLQLINTWNEFPVRTGARPLLLLSLVAGAVIIAGNIWMTSIEFDGRTLQTKTLRIVEKNTGLPGSGNTMVLYGKLLAPVPDDAVVLTTAKLGWPLPTVKGKVVSIYHENPLLLDQGQRYQETGNFFYKPVTDLSRVETVQRYGVTHALVSDADKNISPRVISWLGDYSRLVSQVGGYRMYELSAALHDVELPKPEAPIAEVADTESSGSGQSEVKAESAALEKAPAPQSAPRPPRAINGTLSQPAVDPEMQPPSYGAPIAEPMLDPERHGG